jgi:hypothetical protein
VTALVLTEAVDQADGRELSPPATTPAGTPDE